MWNIKKQIERKKSSYPFLASSTLVINSPTDIDEWPYHRYFRGKRDSYDPIVWDRAAGFRHLENDGPPSKPPKEWKTNLCFQYPCSTILPCENNDKLFEATVNRPVFISP